MSYTAPSPSGHSPSEHSRELDAARPNDAHEARPLRVVPVITAPRTKWVCDHGNGVFDHDWKWVHDSVGDHNVVNGLQHFSYRECRACGAEDHETTCVYEPHEDDIL